MGRSQTKYWINIIQLAGWATILGLSFFWGSRSNAEGLNSFELTMFVLNIIPLLFIYLLNDMLLIPKLLFRDKKILYLILNIIFVSLLLLLSYNVSNKDILEYLGIPYTRPYKGHRSLHLVARDLINYILMVGFVTGLRLMGRLQESEEALKEAENARIKAELDNLRSQINPHFLLNTLNNIYALTNIDAEKAQKAIKELSLLLRYVLYDNLSEKVLLSKEVDFLKNYIELMRIRLNNQVQLNVEYLIEDHCSTMIAPLIFISLIENAFKHGVSADSPSFIDIRIENNTSTNEVIFSIKNSNNAKEDNDKSGCGIGLDQVRRRLELQYPQSYTWTINNTKEEYQSILILKNVN